MKIEENFKNAPKLHQGVGVGASTTTPKRSPNRIINLQNFSIQFLKTFKKTFIPTTTRRRVKNQKLTYCVYCDRDYSNFDFLPDCSYSPIPSWIPLNHLPGA